MRLLTKALAPLAILFASVSANAADLTTSGDGSVMLSVWQTGQITGDPNDAASVLIDTGINFSDLFNLGGGDSITIDIESIFDISTFLANNIAFSFNNPFMNIVGGATNDGTNQLFSSNDSFVNSAINVELNNSINNTNLFLAELSGSETSINTGSFPNAANGDNWGDDFGTAFQDIDNAFELVDSVPGGPREYDAQVSGEMILFETSSQGTLNGQPLEVNDFGGLFTFAFDLGTGELSFTNLGAAAVPLPAAVWFLGSALIGLMGFSRRRAHAAA